MFYCLYLFSFQNPSPGLYEFKQLFRYSESTIEYHICPLPKYSLTRKYPLKCSIPVTQKKFLHQRVRSCHLMSLKLPGP